MALVYDDDRPCVFESEPQVKFYKSYYGPRHWYFYLLPSICLNSHTDGGKRLFALSATWLVWNVQRDFK